MTDTAHIVLVTIRARAGYEDALRDRLLRQAADSRTDEPACLTFEVSADPEDPAVSVLYEACATADDFEAQLETAHFAAFDRETRTWIAHKDVRRLERLTSPKRG